MCKHTFACARLAAASCVHALAARGGNFFASGLLWNLLLAAHAVATPCQVDEWHLARSCRQLLAESAAESVLRRRARARARQSARSRSLPLTRRSSVQRATAPIAQALRTGAALSTAAGGEAGCTGARMIIPTLANPPRARRRRISARCELVYMHAVWIPVYPVICDLRSVISAISSRTHLSSESPGPRAEGAVPVCGGTRQGPAPARGCQRGQKAQS